MGPEHMHGHSTRGARRRQDIAATRATVAAAVLLCLTAALTDAASPPDFEVSRASEILQHDQNVVHDVAIEMVAAGKERLELSARLTDEGGLIERPIAWTIRGAAGEPVYAGEGSIADVALGPGEYQVAARYGTVDFARNVTLLEGNRLFVSFVLNAGGVRVLPRLQGLGLAPTPAETLIYAASGARRGQLVATTTVPGEIIRVRAGSYRIESRFSAGNAVAVVDVEVKPGIMSAVEIDHVAGLARLAYGGDAAGAVSWQVQGDNGLALSGIEGQSAELVLKPGTYTASAQVGGETLTETFTIAAGETREITLEN